MEAKRFRELVPNKCPVVVAGHCVEYFGDNEHRQQKTGVSIGYLASNNAANAEALSWFLEFVWKEFALANPDAKLVIAGTVCDSLSGSHASIDVLGSVNKCVDFYRRVDVVVNPVQFGTGLKIKNLEAC